MKTNFEVDGPIKISKNVINAEDIKTLVEYTNLLESTHIEKFSIYQDGKRLALQFGEDECLEHNSIVDFSFIEERIELISKCFQTAIREIKTAFNLTEELYVCSFWIAKQYPGATVPTHEDTDNGYNMHFRYSAALYLNTMTHGGSLHFPQLEYYYSPQAGDLVSFASQGTGLHEVSTIYQDRYTLLLWLTDSEDKQISLHN
jgi:hypothetical protein